MEFKEKKPKNNVVKKIILIIVIGVVFFANAGMAVKYHGDFNSPNTPSGWVQDVKGIPTEWAHIFNILQQKKEVDEKLKNPILPNYDNGADNQIMQAGINATPLLNEELTSLLKGAIKPIEPGKYPDVKILLPFKLKNGDKINVVTDWVKGAYNQINPESTEPVGYGKKLMVANKGTDIIIPMEGAKISIGTVTINGQKYISDYVIIFEGPDGTTYNLVLMPTEDVRNFQPTDLINDALKNNKNNFDIPLGTTIAVTSAANVEMRASMFAYTTKYPKGIPCNYDFLEKQENGNTVIKFMPQGSP